MWSEQEESRVAVGMAELSLNEGAKKRNIREDEPNDDDNDPDYEEEVQGNIWSER